MLLLKNLLSTSSSRGYLRLVALASTLLSSPLASADPLMLDFHNDDSLANQWEVFFSNGSVQTERLYSNQGEPLVRKQGGGDISLGLIRWTGSEQSVEASVTFRSLPLTNAGSVGVWLGDDPGEKVGVLGMLRILESRKVEMRIYPPISARSIRTAEPLLRETLEANREIGRQEYLTLKLAVVRDRVPEVLVLKLVSAHTGEVLAELSADSPLERAGKTSFVGVRLAGETFLWKNFSVMAPE